MPTVQLSEETLRRLGDLARPFEDTEPEHVIIRLIEGAQEGYDEAREKRRMSVGDGGRPLSSHAGSIPHGAELRAEYKGREYYARIVDGQVRWDSGFYDSISAAAVAVIRSTGSKRTTENGWRFWEVKLDDGSWVPATEFQK